MPGFLLAIVLALAWLPVSETEAQAGAVAHHDLSVTLSPAQHRIEVHDVVTLPAGLAQNKPLRFTLHPALTITAPPHQLTCLPGQSGSFSSASEELNIIPQTCTLPDYQPGAKVTLRYSGPIYHALRQSGSDYAVSQTAGLIAAEGAFLTGASLWYPQFESTLVSFSLEVMLPESWLAVSQGRRSINEISGPQRRQRWEEGAPQEDIYLVAGPWTEYSAVAGAVTAQAFLRSADPALARQYLETTGQFIEFYQRLIGPYPYSKFALIENFWETGYGMPSFTLLGAKVIRLPFIRYSSYPHEILHNWWGNGVYVDYSTGNWAEGLTSYLADHLLTEQRGEAAAERRDLLQYYADFVRLPRNDFPLAQFHARHSASSQAIGYGKAQMVFHMLRQQLGDKAFIRGLQRFYQKYRFQRASFRDLFAELAAAGQTDLGRFAAQWIERVGAPELRISNVQISQTGGGHTLTGTVEQLQAGAPFELSLPVAVTLQGVDTAYQVRLALTQQRQVFSIAVPGLPLRLDGDPEFDVFRRLNASEIPAALSLALGAERTLIVLPTGTPPALRKSYEAMATRWQADWPAAVSIVRDADIDQLPADRAVWLLGWENRLLESFKDKLREEGVSWNSTGVVLDQTTYSPEQHCVVLATRQRTDPRYGMVWLGAGDPAAVAGLTRKLPHYGRYSYLVFAGREPTNVAKGQWPTRDSPLTVVFSGSTAGPARLAPRPPLAVFPLPAPR